MAEIKINTNLDELRDENNRLLSELQFCRKQLDFIENYRKLLLKFKTSCVCDQNKDIKSIFNSLEVQYNKLFEANNEIRGKSKFETSGQSLGNPPKEDTQSLEQLSKVVVKRIESTLQLVNPSLPSTQPNGETTQQKTGEPEVETINLPQFLLIKSNPKTNTRKTVNPSEGLKLLGKNSSTDNPITLLIALKDLRPGKPINESKVLKVSPLSIKIKPKVTQKTINSQSVSSNNQTIGQTPKTDSSKESVLKDPKPNEVVFKCEFIFCDYKSSVKSEVESHYSIHSGDKPYKCPEKGCDVSYKTLYSLKLHLKKHKDINLYNKYVCDWPECGVRYAYKESLSQHVRTHTGQAITSRKIRQIIESGNYISTTDKSLQFSVISQKVMGSDGTEEERRVGYKCNYSECRFVNRLRSKISEHIKIHIMGKTLKCDLCDKRFGSSSNIIQHKKYVHNIKNIPLLECQHPDCQYKSRILANLHAHSATHRNERPFNCDQCKHRSKTERCLKLHKKQCHSKDSKQFYRCDECIAKFKTAAYLSAHIKRRHKGFEAGFYECNYCSKCFSQSCNLRRHMRTIHHDHTIT